MRLTQKLLGLLHRVFDPDPERFIALRIRYGGGLVWTVSEGVLTTTVSGGIGSNLTINLVNYTIRQLINFLSQQPGYSVTSSASSEQMSLSARILIDGSGNIAASNGDRLFAYTSLVWVYLESVGVELRAAKAQIPQALNQMSITTASDDWIDELGAYYGVPRLQGENDASYGARIIAEVVRPRSNNVAMEAAISYYTGQKTKVTDVTVYGDRFPKYNGAITRNSAYKYQTQSTPRYGLFDVQYGYDLLGGQDPSTFASTVAGIIDRLRAAGTHLRALSLQAGTISDDFTPPTDGDLPITVTPILSDSLTAPADVEPTLIATIGAMSDPLDAPADTFSGSIAYAYKYNSVRRRNSAITYAGGTTAAL